MNGNGAAPIFGRTRATLVASVLAIILTAALSLLATLTAAVLDRRRDFALMKALGATQRLASAFFAAETLLLALLGSVLGFAIGVAIAIWIGYANLHTAVAPRFNLLPAVLAGGVAIALAASVVPLARLRQLQPAAILKGE